MSIDGKYCPTIPCRWNSYTMYRLLILMFLMNETSLVFGAAEIAHSVFFIQAVIHVCTIIFVGIPLIYSEICIAQYSNCSLISMWNYFPLFRGLGYGMFFSVILRTMYLNCMTSWYLVYSFYSALDSPPWTNCDFFGEKFLHKCMVKKTNISTYQYSLKKSEQDIDVPYYTASYIFFENLIGGNNTYDYPKSCFFQWETMIAAGCINFSIFILAIKKHKYVQIGVKLAIFYVGIVVLILFFVALLEEGSWELTKMDFQWNDYNVMKIIDAIKKAFLTTGSGTGMIAYLSRDASFRSPATMTAIVTSLFGTTICLCFALTLFSGIKAMVFYHGGEERVLEEGRSVIFTELASVSEILSYFNSHLWTFLWFSAVFYCMFVNLWMWYGFLNDIIFTHSEIAQKYNNLFRFIIKFVICVLSLPFLCSDLFESLIQASLLIQILTSLCFSISLYWFYGYKRHSIDITFMIGIKPSVFWKVIWLINPVLIFIVLFSKLSALQCQNYSFIFSSEINPAEDSMTMYWLLFYILLSIYAAVVIIATIFELMTYRHYNLRKLFTPSKEWGPRDTILFKSRKMFVPSLMTSEFMYRQVRIRGYRSQKLYSHKKETQDSEDSVSEKIQWSAVTSN
ncbi:hypothetical protein O0L34_g10261 [Tuta absoluta]|nr:hypothetical protein O0L34_g10261 [Tuta absoluta]